MQKYKFIQRANPLKPEEAKKWHATPMTEKAMDVKAMTRAATENTSTAPIEMESALELFGKFAIQQLQQGHTIRVGNLGTLRVTFKSEGVDDIAKFNTTAMIKNVRVLFTPSKELREGVLNGLSFENGGVLENGVTYASVQSYFKAKGIKPEEEK